MKELLQQTELIIKKYGENLTALLQARGLDVTKDQWKIINYLSKNNGANQKQVAAGTQKDPAALTRMLDLMVEKNLLQRKTSKQDRRSFDIFLTVDGSRLASRFAPIENELIATMFYNVSDAKITASQKIAQQLIENLSSDKK